MIIFLKSRLVQIPEHMPGRDYILDRLKKKGLRITSQRKPIRLTGAEWTKVVECGLKSMGYLQNQKIDTIMLCSCECENETCCSL